MGMALRRSMGEGRRTSLLFRAALAAALAIFLGSTVLVRAQEEGEASALLKEGLIHFQEGKYSEAITAFEKAFAQNPTNDQIGQFLDAANSIVVMQMIRADDPKIAGIGLKLLELRRAARRTKASDAERISADVEKFFSTDDDQERLLKMLTAANEFGRNLVPALLPKLGDAETTTRTRAYLWVTKLEKDAVLPLVAAAQHPNQLVRLNVARLLGTRPLRDPFALGTLAAMAEKDADEEVRQSAKESLEATVRDGHGTRIYPAKEYHYEIAKKLLDVPHQNPFAGPEYAAAVYKLNGEELVAETIAPFQFAPRLAEMQLVAALRLDPAYHKAKVLKICNEALMVVQYDEAVKFYGTEGAAADVKAVLDGQKAMMDSVRRLRIRAETPAVLLDALSLAVRENHPEAAEKLIEVIRDNEMRGPIPAALVETLATSSSRLVRIAAAEAIALWNPEDTGSFGEAAVAMLAEAAVNSGIRTVHKVMGGADNVARFDDMLRELNLESGVSLKGVAEALNRSHGLPPDLILMDEDVKANGGAASKAPVNLFINELHNGTRTAATPVVVAVDPAKLDEKKKLYENEEKNVLVIPANIDRTGFRNQVIDRLFAGSDDAKARATGVAIRAANALAHLTGAGTRLPVSRLAKAIEPVLTNRPDEVRIPCLQTLGNLRGAAAGSLQAVAQAYGNGENSVAVREAAMVAVGKILSASKGPAPAEVLKTILSAMGEADPKLRAAGFIAFAGAGASNQEQLRVLIDEIQPAAAAEATPPKEGETPVEPKAEDAEEKKPADEADKKKDEAKEESGDAEKKEEN